MSNVVKFRLKARTPRARAMRWLKDNVKHWPTTRSIGKYGIGDELFHGWRFVDSRESGIYFANCIDQGISKAEFNEARIAKRA